MLKSISAPDLNDVSPDQPADPMPGAHRELTGLREAHLGNRLKDLRTAAGLTQLQLADRAGISRKTVNTLENKVLTPSTVLALRLSRALDTPFETLFFLEE
ncbi:MAG TPA: helix-turn-helix transcriptional regulator [Caulobacteraceae bacterium]